MPITPFSTTPLSTDPDTFSARMDIRIVEQQRFITEANSTAAAMNLNSTTDTSASAVLIGTGAKTFGVSAGKSFQPGMYLVIADTAAPSTNSMFGQITSYSGTTLVMNIITVVGGGTFAAWTISQSASTLSYSGTQNLVTGAALNESLSTLASSATPDIWANQSNLINYTGVVTATGFAAAPQAGVRRTLILAGASSFTAGANMLIDGVVSFPGAAGDEVEVEAVTTTQFRLRPKKANGTAVIVTPPSGSIIASGYTQTAARLLGRTTAATGAIEEITVGAGLTFSAGTLSGSSITLGTPVASTAGAAIDFTGIPSGAKVVTINYSGVSFTAAASLSFRLGVGSTADTAGYLSNAATISVTANTTTSTAGTTTGFVHEPSAGPGAPALTQSGSIIFTLLSAATNTWVASGISAGSGGGIGMQFIGGTKSLAGVLGMVSVYGGTFDAGTINISYQ